jgi:hypothetical protein
MIGDEDFDITSEFDSLGGVTVTEDYTVPCATLADVQTPDQSVADAQAWADFEAMQIAITADPSLGLSASLSLQATIVGIKTSRRRATSDGRSSMVRFSVHIFAANN